ncbi:hypothetical protein SLE2022_207060 [Rubroshorea leprosula]
MGSTVIVIPHGEGVAIEKKKFHVSLIPLISYLWRKKSNRDMRKLIHSIKVGIALVLVSPLYLLDPLYKKVGENAVWAVMTVVVIFEFYAGATLSKGLNRGIGTILGGGLGCLAAAIAQKVGGIGNTIIVGISVFIFGAAATYSRLVPRVKRRYDYGAMIFILTFNLIVVSGLRAEKVMEVARERLSTIVMGFIVCILTSLFVFPIWAGDEFHDSTASKFESLARSVEGCMEECFNRVGDKQNQPSDNFNGCKLVVHSKAKDETLVNFAKWEPWHGKFGLSYHWEKYLKIGEVLRDLAAIIISLQACLQSPIESSETLLQSIKEPCEAIGSSLAWTLRALGESLKKMRKCQSENVIAPRLKSMRLQLSLVRTSSALGQVENAEGLAIASFIFLLMEMVNKVEDLAKEMEELGELAGFHAK